MAGETVATTDKQAPYEASEGMFLVPFALTYGSTNNETNDVMEAGYIPANCTVYGILYVPSDMDTNVSPAVVHKVSVGSTDIVTGLTGAQTGTSSVNACAPTTVTAKTKVTVTTTTAAATGAAGTLKLTLICQK